MVELNIHQIAIQPIVRRAVAPNEPNEPNDGEADGAVAQVSTLSANPRILYVLWEKYVRMSLGGARQHGFFKRGERESQGQALASLTKVYLGLHSHSIMRWLDSPCCN